MESTSHGWIPLTKGLLLWKAFPYHDVIMTSSIENQEPYPNTTGVKAWMSNYIPLFHIDVIIHPCPNPGADLDNLYQ